MCRKPMAMYVTLLVVGTVAILASTLYKLRLDSVEAIARKESEEKRKESEEKRHAELRDTLTQAEQLKQGYKELRGELEGRRQIDPALMHRLQTRELQFESVEKSIS